MKIIFTVMALQYCLRVIGGMWYVYVIVSSHTKQNKKQSQKQQEPHQIFYQVYQAGKGEPIGHVNKGLERESIRNVYDVYTSMRNNNYMEIFCMCLSRIKNRLKRRSKER